MDDLVLRRTGDCGLSKTLAKPNRDRKGAPMQAMTAAGVAAS